MTGCIEELLSKAGDPGRAQLIVWSLMAFNFVHLAMNQQFNILTSYVPPHHCHTSGWANISLPSDSSCFMYKNPLNHSEGITHCKYGWDYQPVVGEIYPANEFDLVCDNEYLLHLELSITYSGVMLGGLVFGAASDAIGRKRTMCLILAAMSICSISIYFAPNFVTFVCIRFTLGILAQGLQTTTLTYDAELFRVRMRTIAGAVTGFINAIMLPTQGALFYYLGHWRNVHLVMGVLMSISAIYSW